MASKWPKWIIDTIGSVGYRCLSCSAKFSAKGVEGAGIKDSTSDPNKQVLYIQYQCPSCKERNIIEFQEMDFSEFVSQGGSDSDEGFPEDDEGSPDFIEQEVERRQKRSKKRNSSSKKAKRKSKILNSRITLKETKAAKKLLRECETHEDFLRAIGAYEHNDPDAYKENFKIDSGDE